MNILTGIVFCVLVLSFVCVRGSDKNGKECDIYASVCAVSLVCAVLIAGHWLAVLLGRL